VAYATYTTNAIVCGSRDSDTADRSYLLFTERAGMLWATARSVRLEVSKQRFALQDFSVVRVSLVRGKSGWRIGSVESLGNPFLAARNRETRTFFQQLTRLLRRFLHGEESTPAIFADALELFSNPPAPPAQAFFAALFELRQLYHLGYITSRPSYALYLEGAITAHTVASVPAAVRAAIDHAHTVSHL
jgi:recombinational DNA repair protein (RecF pathway)